MTVLRADSTIQSYIKSLAPEKQLDGANKLNDWNHSVANEGQCTKSDAGNSVKDVEPLLANV